MKKFSPLSWQILKKVIIVHGVVAIVLTSFQLMVDYNKHLDSIKQNLSSSYEMFGPSMSEAVYHFNVPMIEEIFHGILSQSDFLGVAVYDNLADELTTRGNISIKKEELKPFFKYDSLFFHLDNNPDIIAYQHSMSIEGNLGKEQYFGNLIVFSNKELAFERIKDTIFIVLINSLIKAMVLVTMFILIFNRLLIQPITKINALITDLSPQNLESLRLDLNMSQSNELYTLQTKFNQLLNDLYDAQEKERILQHHSKFIAIGEMIENIAHQWRQPLSTVNTVIALLIEKQKHNKLNEEYLETKLLEIETLNHYMSDTIEDFLKFFNPNKEIESFKLIDVIDNSIGILKTKLEKENIDIILNIPQSIAIETNKQELMQVLIILLSNAVDAITENQESQNRKIEIGVITDDNLSIVIKDFGKGIDHKIIYRIFEPYFTTKHKSQGVGLGLYIAKMIVEKSLKGKITAKNHENGAMFVITLP